MDKSLKLSKHSIQFSFSFIMVAFMATLVVVSMYNTKCRSAINLEPNLCVKFAIKFSESSKIVVRAKVSGGYKFLRRLRPH